MIGPPLADVLAMLTTHGQLRRALQSPATLLALSPGQSDETTTEILADVRGRW